jgi:undecaprenyl-diphosphatase
VGRPRSNPAIDSILAAVAVLIFICIAYLVTHGLSTDFDSDVREAVHALSSVPLTHVLETITQLGGAWFLLPFGIVIAALLLRGARRQEAALFALAILGAELVNEILKLFFHRARPDSFFGYPTPVTYSFPSGHSFVSYCFYLALAEILIEPDWPQARKLGLWILAAALVLVIGFSRVYLGVHYPTDVIAGYTAATAWTAGLRAAHHRWWS